MISLGGDFDDVDESFVALASASTNSATLAAIFALPCDILVPAARPDVIHADNARARKAKLILQGANIPATDDAEQILHERGILNLT